MVSPSEPVRTFACEDPPVLAQAVEGSQTPALSVKSVLRWAGSKRGMLRQLLDASPSSFGTYIEPFVGSACLYFALSPDRAILGDYNSQLMAAWRTVRDRPREVAVAVSSLPATPENYYSIRDDDSNRDEFHQAVRFIYLNRHCFNGVYRTNRQGRFNVPMGRKTGQVPSPESFEACAKALRRADLITGDYLETLQAAQPGDFVYLDPPYANDARRGHGEYGYGCFSEASETPRMRDLLGDLDSRGVNVLLSYGSRSLLGDLAGRWTVVEVSARRSLAADPTKRTATPGEILAWNYSCPRGGSR